MLQVIHYLLQFTIDNFQGSLKILICGGYIPGGMDKEWCEAINLESPASTCKDPPNFPAKVEGAIGGLGIKENPIICGGYQGGAISKRCYSLESNKWVSSNSMSTARHDAAATQLQDGRLLVTGGYNPASSYLNSAEMLTEQGWESTVPSLPVIISEHCMVTLNSTTVMAIGGYQNEHYSGKTFYFTVGEESWTEGPVLKNKRSGHSCGKIRKNKESPEMSIIVAGGFNGSSYLSSVELLNVGSNEWQRGSELPFGIGDSQMVEDQNGGVVLIGGGAHLVGCLSTLYQLADGGVDAEWTEMEQKMNIRRKLHKAFLVPNSSVDCS